MTIATKFITGALIVSTVAIVSVLAVISYGNSSFKGVPLVYAQKDMLQEMWTSYKANYIEAGSNRTLDKQQNNITTSEGQSYTMLRAAWMDDQQTFDDSWQWTKDNLQRDDFLMSWKFGQQPNGQYGIQDTVGGQNTATDGDSDIALSLLMAYSRWKQDKYLYDAKSIIASIWEKEVVIIDSKPVLVANDLERNNAAKVIVNPSYFSPYAYKIFSNVDKANDWKGLADNTYSILGKLSELSLDTSRSAGLPPDWVAIDRSTGNIQAVDNANLTSSFSFDAIRIPWRLALDYKWFADQRSYDLLSHYTLLDTEWRTSGRVVAAYSHDGVRVVDYETPATYGATMGYFSVINPTAARDIYINKLTSLYDPDEQKPKAPLSYYDDNWAWFGTALYLNELPNLTAKE